MKKGLGHEEAETQVEVDSNSERELARETTTRNRIKTGFKEKQNRKRKPEQKPEERESLTGRNQVNSKITQLAANFKATAAKKVNRAKILTNSCAVVFLYEDVKN